MEQPYFFLPDLGAAIQVPEGGILSKPVFDEGGLRAVLFGFDAGQQLSEHTASVPAVIHILSGQATLQAGSQTLKAGPGAWLYMQANLEHAVFAETPLTMLLLMLR